MRKVEMTLEDGSTVFLTLNMGALLELRGEDEELYNEYFRIYNKMKEKESDFNELDIYTIVYIGYRCGGSENKLSMVDFLKLMPDDRAYAGQLFKKLYGVVDRQKKAFQNHSGRPHARAKAK